MLETLPKWIHSQHLAVKGRNLKGQVAISELSERLCDNLCNTDGYVQIDWQFILDDKKRPTISGQVETQLQMLCQRCLIPVVITVNAKVALVVFTEEPSQYEELPPDYETITLPNKPVSLLTLIENELILALPVVAKHEICPSNEFQMQDEAIEQNDNPFSVLSKLK
ncbi:YceD family protein [Candidatus Halobeggiatoa sp. HSG11]|nr:YceD family protein [Candidatus Halobeggiatoa sp. HSG11]